MAIHRQVTDATLVQRYVNTSYDTVKKVADNMDILEELAATTEVGETLTEVVRVLAEVQALSDGIAQSLLDKQNVLVSGTNIRTVNGSSILGAGNISIVSPVQVSQADLTGRADDLEQLIMMGV